MLPCFPARRFGPLGGIPVSENGSLADIVIPVEGVGSTIIVFGRFTSYRRDNVSHWK